MCKYFNDLRASVTLFSAVSSQTSKLEVYLAHRLLSEDANCIVELKSVAGELEAAAIVSN